MNYLDINAWQEELDPSFEFYDEVLDGVRYGFPLINRDLEQEAVEQVERDNYHSATNPTDRYVKRLLKVATK